MKKIPKETPLIVANNSKLLSKVAFFLFVYVLIYFTYRGTTTSPLQINDIDSLSYHIPIAVDLSKFRFFNPTYHFQGLQYYPAVGEAILAMFIQLNLPLNTYNVLAIILLYFTCYKLATNVDLRVSEVTIFSTSVVFLNSVLRLVNNQTVDIWLAVFYTALLVLMIKNIKRKVNPFLLGVFSGLVIGIKFSGPLYIAVMLLVFYRDLKKYFDLKNLIIYLFPVVVLGGSWYIRNYILTGNPLYPAHVFGLSGHGNFVQKLKLPLYSLIYVGNDTVMLFKALMTEYLVWATSLILIPIVYLKTRYQLNSKVKQTVKKMIQIGLLNFFVFLFLHSAPANYISDVRYLFVAFIPLILAAFMLARALGFEKEIKIVAALNIVSVLPQLSYRPKIIFVWIMLVSLIVIYSNKIRFVIKQ